MEFREKKTGNIIVAKTQPIIESYKKNPLYEVADKPQEEKPQESKPKGNK